MACAGALAKDASCAAGALGASAGTVINNLLGSVDGLSNEEKEARKNLVTTVVGGIATAVGSGDAANATLAAQLETENNALASNVHQLVIDMRRCSGSSSSSCFDELKEKTEERKLRFNAVLKSACSGEGATLLSCQDKIRAGESAYPYIGLAMAYAKTDEQKAYVKQLLAEQENDLVAQFPRLEALGAQASLLDHLLVELATTIDNPAGVVASLNSLRAKISSISNGKYSSTPAGTVSTKLPNGKSVEDFEKELAFLPMGERVALTKKMASLVVESQQWVKDRKLTKLNGRDVYDGKDGYLYAIDTQHGRFERVNAKSGKHVEEVKMNMSPVDGSKDSSGGHDLRIK